MKLSTVFLSGLLIASHLIASEANHGIYYSELKALKKASETKGLFEQDVDGGSHTTQCNLGMYESISVNNKLRIFFSNCDILRRGLSLGNIKRQIMISKKLSFIDSLLITRLCGCNDDLLIVTHETMPALYDYVDSLAKEAKIPTPFVFVTLKEGFFSAFSRKILAFRGSVVIGQRLLQDVSDEELEALVAQQIGHIKYNHTNKKIVLNGAVALGLVLLVTRGSKFDMFNNKMFTWLVLPASSSLLVSKRFEKQVDTFASEIAGKSDGLVKFYERLQQKDQLRVAEFDEISTMLIENSADIPMLSYLSLVLCYYLAKAEHCVAEIYNNFAYPTHQERIDAAKEYLA